VNSYLILLTHLGRTVRGSGKSINLFASHLLEISVEHCLKGGLIAWRKVAPSLQITNLFGLPGKIWISSVPCLNVEFFPKKFVCCRGKQIGLLSG